VKLSKVKSESQLRSLFFDNYILCQEHDFDGRDITIKKSLKLKNKILLFEDIDAATDVVMDRSKKFEKKKVADKKKQILLDKLLENEKLVVKSKLFIEVHVAHSL